MSNITPINPNAIDSSELLAAGIPLIYQEATLLKYQEKAILDYGYQIDLEQLIDETAAMCCEAITYDLGYEIENLTRANYKRIYDEFVMIFQHKVVVK